VNADWERGYAAGYSAAHRTDVRDLTVERGMSAPTKPVKRTRKPSAYNRKYAKEYKLLRKKHPRMSFSALSKKTHKALRRKK
jgi:hypothetical protein